jgi:hypothetical protein
MAFIEYPSARLSRDSPFVRGHRYRVVQDAPSYSGYLAAGECLMYFGAYIGIYDGVHVYAFTNEHGQERTWLVRWDEPRDKWSKVFTALPDVVNQPTGQVPSVQA